MGLRASGCARRGYKGFVAILVLFAVWTATIAILAQTSQAVSDGLHQGAVDAQGVSLLNLMLPENIGC